MNTPSDPRTPEVLVWDAPVRVFHWLLAISFAGAFVTAESERWRLVHVSLGYTVAGLIAFRLLWGLVGTRHARFAAFVRGPAAVGRYLRSLGSGHPDSGVGHNPAGGWAILGLLGLGLATALTGWLTYQDLAGGALEEAHEVLAHAMLLLVGVHVAGVAVSSWLHRRNLVRGMVTGRQPGDASQAIARPWRAVGALLLAAVLGFWGWQATHAPEAGTQITAGLRHDKAQHDDDD